MNYAQIKAIEKKNKERILKVCPEATEERGIYIFTRHENGFSYGYVGQAKHILSRLAGHLKGYQHIDLSIKKHGLYDENNPTGWQIRTVSYPISELNEKEREWICKLAGMGYQLRNKTSGGQGKGKTKIADYKPSKGYRDGLARGYENARKLLAPLFEKYLTITYDESKKLAEKAYNKFNDFIKGEQNNE